MLKTIASQCILMLYFCDRYLYCLCPYFAWCAFFMWGGLDKSGIDPEIKDFVFPNLHSMKRESVAGRLTKVIRNSIDVTRPSKEEAKKRKNCYSSRSMRRGSMTKNRANPDLSLLEEYERSGIVGSTPAVTTPGGLALAGFKNCHFNPLCSVSWQYRMRWMQSII